jgi:hypothetical protein
MLPLHHPRSFGEHQAKHPRAFIPLQLKNDLDLQLNVYTLMGRDTDLPYTLIPRTGHEQYIIFLTKII